MKIIRCKRNFPVKTRATQSASSRPLVLALVGFVLGAVIAGGWFYRQNAATHGPGLSEQTRSSLANLTAPVTIRFYSVLPAGSADEKLTAFSTRIEQLLAAVQMAGNGKIEVKTIEDATETNAAAASADGIQGFNHDKGDACFLGLALSSGASRQTLPRLQLQWEPALQYDLARAILAVASAATPPVSPEVAKPGPEIVNTINRLFPDVKAVAPEQADKILHDEYLKKSAELAAETEAKIQAAQQMVVQAQNSGSQTDLVAARKNLLQVQLAQAEQLKQLAAQLDIQLAVFQRMKAGITNNSGN